MNPRILNTWKLLLSAILLTVSALCFEAKAQDISVRTNLLWDGLAEPNLGVEFELSRHFTLGGNVGLKSWPRWLAWDWDVQNPVHWRNFVVAPELRFYFDEFDKKKGKVFEGAFIGTDILYTHFNVGQVTFPFGLYPQVRDHRLQGDLWGLGLFGGYAWRLKDSRWRVEVEGGVAVGYHAAGVFECEHCGAQVGESRGVVLVPKLGVNLAFDVKRKREEKEEILEIIAPLESELVVEPQPQPQPVPIAEIKHKILRHPVVRPASEYRPYTPDRVLRKEEGALYVFFPMNKSTLERNFTDGLQIRENGAILDEIMDVTAEILTDSVARVSCIQIIGLASVDGPADFNQALSLARAQALQKYIQDRLPVPDSMFETVGGGEAWTELKDIVQDLLYNEEESDISTAQLQEVLDILESEGNPSVRKRKLRALDDGKVYRKLTEGMLKDLRNSGYVRVYIEER